MPGVKIGLDNAKKHKYSKTNKQTNKNRKAYVNERERKKKKKCMTTVNVGSALLYSKNVGVFL